VKRRITRAIHNQSKPLFIALCVSVALAAFAVQALGSFSKPRHFSVGTFPASVAISDLNGDGKRDLAVANTGSNNVSVLLGNGAGSFGRPKDFVVGAEPGPIAIADFNGDSRPDLVVANGAQRSVSVLLNGRSSAALSLSYKSRSHRFSGGLRSIDPVCANHRWVVVLRRRKGPDQKVGGAMTSRKGTYSIRRHASGGTYYAHARSSSACRAESSKAITLR
jgi:FG-GAP-like repeat